LLVWDKPEQVLVIADGDLPSVVACAAAREALITSGKSERAMRPVVCLAQTADPPPPGAEQAVRALVNVLALEQVEADLGATGEDRFEGERETRLLIDAAYEAARLGRGTVVWAVQYPGAGAGGSGDRADLSRVAAASDRALLVSRLVGLDGSAHGVPAIQVHTPYVDFTDRQIAELAVDLGAPVQLCWWWKGDSPAAQASRARWETVLLGAGWTPENVVC
jgi:hypothetical protein